MQVFTTRGQAAGIRNGGDELVSDREELLEHVAIDGGHQLPSSSSTSQAPSEAFPSEAQIDPFKLRSPFSYPEVVIHWAAVFSRRLSEDGGLSVVPRFFPPPSTMDIPFMLLVTLVTFVDAALGKDEDEPWGRDSTHVRAALVKSGHTKVLLFAKLLLNALGDRVQPFHKDMVLSAKGLMQKARDDLHEVKRMLSRFKALDGEALSHKLEVIELGYSRMMPVAFLTKLPTPSDELVPMEVEAVQLAPPPALALTPAPELAEPVDAAAPASPVTAPVPSADLDGRLSASRPAPGVYKLRLRAALAEATELKKKLRKANKDAKVRAELSPRLAKVRAKMNALRVDKVKVTQKLQAKSEECAASARALKAAVAESELAAEATAQETKALEAKLLAEEEAHRATHAEKVDLQRTCFSAEVVDRRLAHQAALTKRKIDIAALRTSNLEARVADLTEGSAKLQQRVNAQAATIDKLKADLRDERALHGPTSRAAAREASERENKVTQLAAKVASLNTDLKEANRACKAARKQADSNQVSCAAARADLKKRDHDEHERTDFYEEDLQSEHAEEIAALKAELGKVEAERDAFKRVAQPSIKQIKPDGVSYSTGRLNCCTHLPPACSDLTPPRILSRPLLPLSRRSKDHLCVPGSGVGAAHLDQHGLERGRLRARAYRGHRLAQD